MTGRKERVDRITTILEMCHKNKWTFDTPNLAGRIERILTPTGFTLSTIRDYTRAIVDILEAQKMTREYAKLPHEQVQQTRAYSNLHTQAQSQLPRETTQTTQTKTKERRDVGVRKQRHKLATVESRSRSNVLTSANYQLGPHRNTSPVLFSA